MRLLDRRTPMSPALLLCSFGCAIGALPQVSAAQPWLPLVRESRAAVIADVLFEAHSIPEVDPGVFEIRLIYEPVAWTCAHNRDGECDVYPDHLLRSYRITVIRIRCRDMSYEEVAMWVGPGIWRQLSLMEFRHPPGGGTALHPRPPWVPHAISFARPSRPDAGAVNDPAARSRQPLITSTGRPHGGLDFLSSASIRRFILQLPERQRPE